MWDLLSHIEYFVHKDAIDKNDQNEHSNNTQEYLLGTAHSLYENQDKPVQTQQIDILHETGASIMILPSDFEFAWTNVRDSLHIISGCLKGTVEKYTQIREFHALITLNTGETKHAIIPEAILIPSPTRTNTYLVARATLLMAGHEFILNLYKPKIKFREGGEYTMTVRKGHQMIKLLPINAEKETAHQNILIHNREPYDPPTFINNVLFTQNANRHDVSTPIALIYHLRYGCMSEPVLQHTQRHVIGMHVQQGSWKKQKQQLPCSSCLAGKMRKLNKAGAKDYTDLDNLALSWTPNTAEKKVRPNEEAIPNQNNVFALFLDLNTGLIFVFTTGEQNPRSNANVERFMQHLTSCLTKCDDTQYRNLKVYIQAIAFLHNIAFNSAINCTPFEAGHGLRARTITEARASPRLQITAEEGTDLQEPDINKWESTVFYKICKLAERLAEDAQRQSPWHKRMNAHNLNQSGKVISDKPLEQGSKVYFYKPPSQQEEIQRGRKAKHLMHYQGPAIIVGSIAGRKWQYELEYNRKRYKKDISVLIPEQTMLEIDVTTLDDVTDSRESGTKPKLHVNGDEIREEDLILCKTELTDTEWYLAEINKIYSDEIEIVYFTKIS
jgi:hypothetical protein